MSANSFLTSDINLLNPNMEEQEAVLGQDLKIQLKVEIESSGQNKMMKFDLAEYVADCLKQIAKVEHRDEANADYGDNGLYHKNIDPTKCRWLEESKTLRYYDVHNLDEVAYRKKHRSLGILLLDGAKRKVMIDDSAVVEDLNEFIGRKLNIANPEEFSLKKQDTPDSEWLNPHKTLHEQGILPETELIYKKKFFFHDANVDTDDKVTLNLLYEQIKEQVLTGVLPVAEDDATLLAGIMCQIILGPHDPSKHKPATLNLADYLPVEYRGVKNIAKKILQNHSILGTKLDQHQAKFRYVQAARTVETYGITFYRCREVKKDAKGRALKKFVPVLLGVSRAAIHRVDTITKKNMEGSPYALTSLRRWAPSKDSLVLDFGDYMDDYYTVLTSEGDAIATLIAGYIDIILGLRRDKQRKDEEEEQQAVYEDLPEGGRAGGQSRQMNTLKKLQTQSVAKPTALGQPTAGKSGQHRAGMSTPDTYSQGTQGQNIVVNSGPVTTRIVTQELENAQQQLNNPRKDYDSMIAGMLDDLNDPDEKKRLKNLQSARDMLADVLADLSGATGDAISAAAVSDPGAFKRDALVSSAKRIMALSNQLNMAAALNGKISGDPNIDAAAADVNKKIGKLLQLANLAALDADAGNGANLADLLACARDMGAAINNLANSGGIKTKATVEELNQKLVEAAEALAKASSPEVMGRIANPEKRKEVELSAKGSRDGAEQLAANVSMVGISVSQPRVQSRLNEKGADVDGKVKKLLTLMDGLDDMDAGDRDALMRAANLLAGALGGLMAGIKQSGENVDRSNEIIAASKELDTALAAVMNADSEASLAAAVKMAEKAATKLASLAQLEADAEGDEKLRNDLLKAARDVAEMISRLNGGVQAVKTAANQAEKAEQTAKVVATASELSDASRRLAEQRRQKKALAQLAQAAKRNAEMTNALNVAVENMKDNRNMAAASRAREAARPATAQNKDLFENSQIYQAKPSSLEYQKALLASSKTGSASTSRFVLAAKGCAPGCVDATEELAIKEAADQAAEALKGLLDALRAAQDACWTLDVEAAQERVRDAKKEIDSAIALAKKGTLTPGAAGAGGDDNFAKAADFANAQMAQDALSMHAESVTGAIDALAASTKTTGGEGVGINSKQAADNVYALASSARSVAAFSSDKDTQQSTLAATKNVADALAALLKACQFAVEHPSDPNNDENIANAQSEVKALVGEVISALPGQGDCARASNSIRSAANALDLGNLEPLEDGESLGGFNDSLLAASRALSLALSKLVGAAGSTPDELAAAAKKVQTVMATVAEAVAGALAAVQANPTAQNVILTASKELSEATALTLDQARHVAANPDDLEGPNKLQEEANHAQQALDALVAAFSTAAPGATEVDDAANRIAASLARLASVQRAEGNYAENLAALVAAARGLGDATGTLATAARTDASKVTPSVETTATSLDGVVDAAANALAVMPGATGGSADLASWQAQAEKIYTGLGAVPNLTADTKKCVKVVAQVARMSATLADEVKNAAATMNEGAAAVVTDAAALVTAITNKMVSAAKKLAASPEDPKMQQLICAAAIKLQEAMMQMLQVAQDSTGGGDDQAAAQMQRKLVDAVKAVGTAVSSLVASSKVMMTKNKDVAAQSLLRSSSKQANETIAALIKTATEAQPGQAECADALEHINSGLTALDAAAMAASVGELKLPPGQTAETCRTGVVSSMKELSVAVKNIGSGAKNDAQELAAAAATLGSLVEKFVQYAQGAAATCGDPDKKHDVINNAQAVLNSCVPLVVLCRDMGGEKVKDKERTKPITDAQKAVVANVQALMQAVSNSATAGDTPAFDEADNTISEALAAMQAKPPPQQGMGFADYQEDVTQRAKKLAAAVVALSTAAKKNPDAIEEKTREAAAVLPKLLLSIGGIADMSSAGDDLLAAAQALADACRKLVGAAKDAQTNPNDETKVAVGKIGGGDVARAIGSVITLAQSPAKGGREADDAIAAIEAASNDLQTAELMANTKQLKPARAGDSYGNYQGDLQKSALAVAGSVGKLIQGAAGPTEELAALIGAAATPLTQMCQLARDGAATLPDSGTQVELLSSARALAEALSATVQDALTANGKPDDKKLAKAVKADAKVVAEAVRVLVEKINSLESVATQGKVAADQAAAEIQAALEDFDSANASSATKATAEELQDEARTMARVIAKLVLAAKAGQADVAAASAEVSATIAALMQRCKATAAEVADPVKSSFLQATHAVAEQTIAMMQTLSEAGGVTKDDRAAHKKLTGISKLIAEAVGDLVAQTNMLANPDGADETSQTTEKEMLGAASEINNNAAKLNKMRPPTSKSPEEGATFEEMIVDACKAIFAACAALVTAATAAQREIVKQGRANEGPRYQPDSNWSAGLISAAQSVSGECRQLVKVADGVCKGTQEHPAAALMAAAQGVTRETVHLSTAAQVKGDPNHKTQRTLQGAASNVRQAADALKKAAQEKLNQNSGGAAAGGEEETGDATMEEGVQSQAEIFEAQMKLIRLRDEMAAAQRNIGAINKKKFTKKTAKK